MALRLRRPLARAILVRRYKRFLADVRLEDGRVVTVHCPNSGAMTACCEPGRPVIISDSQRPERKLRWTWEMIRMGRTWVGVHSALANQVAAQLIVDGALPPLRGYTDLEREVRAGDSRIDLRLAHPRRPPAWVEVKFSTMRVGHHAAFPDARSERAEKHLRVLSELCRGGQRAVILFLVGRNDCRRFRPADEVDPAYGAALRAAVDAGVEALAYRLRFTPHGSVALSGAVPVDL